jgi:hypothetical protein
MIAAEHDAIDQAMPAKRYRSDAELEMREAVDLWGRARWPEARVVHELVMDRGKVRADMAFISPAALVSIEIKSGYDDSARMMNQVAMFRLSTPETWLITDVKHQRDVGLVHYLLPTIGCATATREKMYGGPFSISVTREPAPFAPHPEALLSLLWVAELHAEAVRARLWRGNAGTHAALVRIMLRLDPAEQLAAVCRQLRGRDALWRADPPIWESSDA